MERYAISESVECDNENTADKDSDITRPSVPSTDKVSHPDSGTVKGSHPDSISTLISME